MEISIKILEKELCDLDSRIQCYNEQAIKLKRLGDECICYAQELITVSRDLQNAIKELRGKNDE